MSFLYPNILWGLLAVSIPVIIHLFNFRRHRKVYFTNVKYIQELKQQTQRQSKLRHLLVLLARILAIACLVLAFSQPYIPLSESQLSSSEVNIATVYVDNSFSMESESTSGQLLAVAKNKASEIAAAYGPADLFQLLTNDFQGRHQRLVSREEFLELVDEIQLSPAVHPLSNIINRQDEVLSSRPKAKKTRFMISDFQKSMADFDRLSNDSLVHTFLLPVVPQQSSNLFIDSCWFESPVHQLGQGVKLLARIKNESENDYEKLPVKLTVNNTQKALASYDIAAGTSTLVELPFTNHEPGFQYGKLEITDFPVTFDDAFYLTYEVQTAIPVMNIYGDKAPVFLNSLLQNDSAFAYKSVYYKNIDYNELLSYFLIILDGLPEVSSGLAQALSDFVNRGGTLMVIPGDKIDLASYRDLSSNLGVSSYREAVQANVNVSFIDLEHPVFLDVFEDGKISGNNPDMPVDLPKVFSYYPLSPVRGGYRIPLMTMVNRAEFLVAEKAGLGEVFLLAVPLDDLYSNFQRHALFVPVLYRIAFLSGATNPLYYNIGSTGTVTMENVKIEGDRVLKINQMNSTMEFIPGQRNLGNTVNLLIGDQVKEAGFYQVKSNVEVLTGLAFNFDRRESDLSFMSSSDLSEALESNALITFSVLNDKLKPLSESINDLNQGRRLWKLFIILALFFLATEVFLLRIWAKN